MCKVHIYTSDMRQTPSLPLGPAPASAARATSADTDALMQALGALLAPIAQLAVAKGLPCATVEELLRKAFVQAARAAHPQLPAHRLVSRIATATGLNRREVTRLTQVEAEPALRRPLSAELFARWASEPQYRDTHGRPRALPRQGAAPSFETLAQSVTRDVHPRSLLDELLRLGLAALDAGDDSVSLVHDAFVPRGDTARMLGFLGHNVGDHLGAAVANVLGDGFKHFEQAVFADELSTQSVEATHATITAQWQALSAALVPQLEALIEADRAAGRAQDQRLRVGLFSYSQAMAAAVAAAPTTAPDGAPMPAADKATSTPDRKGERR